MASCDVTTPPHADPVLFDTRTLAIDKKAPAVTTATPPPGDDPVVSRTHPPFNHAEPPLVAVMTAPTDPDHVESPTGAALSVNPVLSMEATAPVPLTTSTP